MSATRPTHETAPSASGNDFPALARAGLTALGFSLEQASDGQWTATVEESPAAFEPPRFQGASTIHFFFADADEATEEGMPLSPNSLLGQWLLAQLLQQQMPLSAEPVGEPGAVHEIGGRLLGQYEVAGGSVHLAGCRLKPIAFGRLLSLDVSPTETPVFQVDEEGETVASCDDTLRQRLHLGDWNCCEPPRQISQRTLRNVYQQIRNQAPAVGEPTVVLLEWCHRASGKLEFEIGDAQFSLPFSDWARTVKAPPIPCPVTGEPTYHLAQTDDGRLIAAEQLAECIVSGAMCPRAELVASSVSGKLAQEEFMIHCPVSGDALLKEELVECPTTAAQVAPQAIRDGQSVLLWELQDVSADESPLARLRSDDPQLTGFGKWKKARGAALDIYVGRKVLAQVLLVVDHDTGSLQSMAQKGRLSSAWRNQSPPR